MGQKCCGKADSENLPIEMHECDEISNAWTNHSHLPSNGAFLELMNNLNECDMSQMEFEEMRSSWMECVAACPDVADRIIVELGTSVVSLDVQFEKI